MATSCTKCWYRNISCIEHVIQRLFTKWGYFVAYHPFLTIVLSLILAASLGIFIMFIEEEPNIEQLYAPKGTTSWNNFEQYKATWQQYEDNIGINTIIVYNKSDPSNNILTIEYLSFFLSIYNNITAIEIEHDNQIYKYQDICYKYENGNCQTQSILELYHFDKNIMEQTFSIDPILYPTQYSSYSGEQLFIPLVLGQNISTHFVDISFTQNHTNSNEMNTNISHNHHPSVHIISRLYQHRQHFKWCLI